LYTEGALEKYENLHHSKFPAIQYASSYNNSQVRGTLL